MGERGPTIQPARAATAARRGAAFANARDFQGQLARAIATLSEETGATRVAAWGRDRTGAPAVLAARLESSALLAPDERALALLGQLEAVLDLGDPHASDELRTLAMEHGFAAAAPLQRIESQRGAEPPAILLIGGAERPGSVRPRTLASLAAAAERLSATESPVTRLGQLDQEVQRLDRLAALGSLVAEIVHEIRNPLVSVKTFMQLLPDHADDEEFKGEFHQVALEEVRRIERLLNVVLEHARTPTANRAHAAEPDEPGEGTDLGSAFESLGQLLAFRASDRDISLATDVASDLPRPGLDADALRQVLLNLTLNALDVTPDGGNVRLGARAHETGVAIDVQDEGPGVPTELRERLFEPFFSSKGAERPGGLGLGISRRLVEDAGGRIEILDGAGGGSIFRITLPSVTNP